MYREITIVNSAVYKMPIPKELRGKKIEIIACVVEEDKQISETTNNKSINASFAERTKDLALNANGYHFDRNEANDYDIISFHKSVQNAAK